MLKKIAFVLLVLILMVSGGCWYFVYTHVIGYKNQINEPIIIIVDKGDSIDVISNKIVAVGGAHDIVSAKYYIKAASYKKNIQFGEYLIEPHEKFVSVVNKIVNGKVFLRKIRIPSGLTNRDIFKIIDKASHLNGTYNKDEVLEGMIFPDTYTYRAGDSRQSLVNQMVRTMSKHLWKEWGARDRTVPYASMFDALIIASIIEKEASFLDDKEKVASVFINRLKTGQKLQSDPTVQYHIDTMNGKKTKLMKKHFSMESHHSTYYISGLPVTAICNPSMSSIHAALHPDKTNYYYFISMPDSLRLYFSKSYNEHLNYVSQLNQMRRSMKWRDNYGDDE